MLKNKRKLANGDAIFIKTEYPIQFVSRHNIFHSQRNIPVLCDVTTLLLNLLPEVRTDIRMFIYKNAAPFHMMMCILAEFFQNGMMCGSARPAFER